MGDDTTDTVLDYIAVRIDDPPICCVLARLNLKELLPMTRGRLVQNTKVKMSDTLSFAKKISQTNSAGIALTKIAKENEGNIKLEDIIEVEGVENKILYLKSDPDWKFLNHKCKLNYGRTVALYKANESAFTIEDCEMTEIEEIENDIREIEPTEDIVEANLYLTVENNVQDFAKLGVSVEKFKKSTNANHTYECSKASLKFKELKPTEEFIKAVKIAIESKDLRKFKDITKKFGQFIPKEVIFGGRALFKGLNIQTKYSKGVKGNINVGEMLKVGAEKSLFSLFKFNNKHEGFKLVGGKLFSPKNFDKQAWIESLKDFRNWDCIKFKDPISIFQLLSEDLRKKILTLIGKKILYINIEDYSYKLSQPGILQTFELKNVPENILEILRNEDAECNIFATIICTNKAKGDIFHCQIFCPPNEYPRLTIHCIQKKFKERECKLKIRLMIIGYDINFNFNRPNFDVQLKVQEHEFKASNRQTIIKLLDLEYGPSVLCFGIPVLRNLDYLNNPPVIGHHFYKDEENKRIGLYTFSYCLKENHYVNLPEFTFYILIISNHCNSDNCRILPFEHNSSNFPKPKSQLPKYISLYSIGKNNCGPIFLEQKTNEIKIKYIATTSCDQGDCICKNNEFKKLLKEYAFFDPDTVEAKDSC